MGKKLFNAVKNTRGIAPTPTARMLLLLIADRADNDGYAFCSIRWMAEKADCDETTANRCRKMLNNNGTLLTWKNPKSAGHPKYEHIVLFGLEEERLLHSLRHKLKLDENGVQMILERIDDIESDDVDLFFLGSKTANCRKNLRNAGEKTANRSPKNAKCSKNLRNAAVSTIDPPSDPPVFDTPERDSRSLKNNGNSNLKKPPTTQHPALSAKKKGDLAKNQTTKQSSHHKRPPTPSSAPPPPPTASQYMLDAIQAACGIRAPRNKNQKRRIKKKLRGTVSGLLEEGYTPADVLTMREWWDAVGLGSRPGSTPPHPSQVEAYIDTAIAWKQAGALTDTTKALGEYALAASQPVQAREDAVATRKMYSEEEEVNEYGF